jgi:hypothetical protein
MKQPSYLTEPSSEAATGHTPGPWVATPYGDVMPRGANYLVASCSSKSGMYRDYEANARLIAAAPQLLEAAQAAWNCIAELPPTQARVEVALMLQESIAAATGTPT